MTACPKIVRLTAHLTRSIETVRPFTQGDEYSLVVVVRLPARSSTCAARDIGACLAPKEAGNVIYYYNTQCRVPLTLIVYVWCSNTWPV